MDKPALTVFIVILLIAGYVAYINIKPDNSRIATYGTQAGEFGTIDASTAQLPTNNQSQSQQTMNQQPQQQRQQVSSVHVTLKTSKGDIQMELYLADTPKTVSNFVNLAQKDFYDDVIFHRVIEGFMIQGGDPTGTGTGGPGYTFEDELNPGSEAAQRGYVRGTVAMANSGPDTNGSQFFIMHQDYNLPYNYTIFGRVTSGMDVVDAIATVETNANDKPLEDVVIEDVDVELR